MSGVELPRSAPEAQGIPSSAVLAFVQAAEQSALELHSFMLLRHGHVVAEGWWAPYAPEHPHMLFSLSKSFTSTAVGLAVAEGRLSVDDPVLPFFPEDAPAEVSENLAAMRVRHLLSMSTGHAEDTTERLHTCEDGNWVRAFLARPVAYAPGTHFLYNSGASYMLSAIVQRLAGVPLLEYLRPRLFAPLGIESPTWETCPRGINTGGWGLSVRTEDIARFGQLYLQKGMWQGARILPEAWVDEATSAQITNGSRPDSDWEQGYGYQFWRCRHGAYRGDGAFGQFCVVMPAQDAVLAITSGVQDMQAVLNLAWEHLLPAMGPAPLPGGPAEPLARRLAGLRLRAPQGQPSSPLAASVSGREYVFAENEQKVEAISIRFDTDGCVLTVRDPRGEHQVECGTSAWVMGATTLDSPTLRPVAAAGAWAAEDTYVLKLAFYETPFTPTLSFRFTADGVVFTFKANAGFGPTERPALQGRLA